MTITTIDPNTALIVIDLQKGLAKMPALRPLEDVVAQNNALSRAFRAKGLPVVMVVAAGGSPGRTDHPPRQVEITAEALELMDGLDQDPTDYLLTKHARSAFSRTGLEEWLRERRITQVVVTGIITSNGVETTARSAYELGFNVTLPLDAMTDTSAEAQSHSISKVFPRIAETGTTEDVLALLV